MGLREYRQYLKDKKEQKIALDEALQKQRDELRTHQIIEKENLLHERDQAVDSFYNYKDSVKRILLKKALFEICIHSIQNPSYRERMICENLIDQYITENGEAAMLRKMRHSTCGLLRLISEKVSEYHHEITQDATADDPGSQTLTQQSVNDFWTEIDNSDDMEDVTNTIRMRVSNAEEDFVAQNQEDKSHIKTILQQTASRIKDAQENENRGDDEEYTSAVEAYETKLAKNKIYTIQHEGYRNVFDQMVRKLSKAALTNNSLRDEYITENGKLDMDNIVESVRCMYTLLEMVGTIKLEKVDDKYITETLNSIK